MATWQPSTTISHLKQRANILTLIREFFAKRNILEVETPLLSHATVTDPYVLSIPAYFQAHGSLSANEMYLQTSPEYAMKRLLAAGSGPIYQITKSFRQGDIGRLHNPEFTMLEWYRPGFDHHQLMDEMDDLLQLILVCKKAERISYQKVFLRQLQIDPHIASDEELLKCVSQHAQLNEDLELDRITCLDILMSHCIEPNLAPDVPTFIYDFPVTHAALAKIRYAEQPPVASRFEVYFKGLELANGFHELQNAAEQQKRFADNLEFRRKNNLPVVPVDEHLLAALDFGLPDCAGVALGVDRLIMLALNVNALSDVVAFDFKRA